MMSEPQAIPELEHLREVAEDLDATIARGPDPHEHDGCDLTPAEPDVVGERLAALETNVADVVEERSSVRERGVSDSLEQRIADLEARLAALER
jgi:hypothetical protein